jgi:hypothetical protein
MTTSSDDSVELEAKTVRTPRHSHHKSSRRNRIAARILLILAFVVGVLALSDFAYNAYQKASELSDFSSHEEGIDKHLDPYDELQRGDAAAAMVAAAFLIASTLISRRLQRHRR